MEVLRTIYVNQLWGRKHNGLVKIITGVRRCGKSYLLFKLFKQRLLNEGVAQDHIISIALDDFANESYLEPHQLFEFVKGQAKDTQMYYVLLDEIQLVPHFENVLNGFLHLSNVDVYVTGSNSRFLSSDIITEFRGRGDELRVYPLSFAEFFSVYTGSVETAWKEYQLYGGMPGLLAMESDERKAEYLKKLFEQTYFADIVNRYNLRGNEEVGELVDIIASSIGSLTNTLTLTNTFNSIKHLSISRPTVSAYIQYLQDAFLITQTKRFDVRGKRYIASPVKYYFVDPGLRNARLDFRQRDYGAVMENIIYNVLCQYGWNVDVGMVEYNCKMNGKSMRKQLEVDFVCNKGNRRYYIQSAYEMDSEDKYQQEIQSFKHINDSFQRVIIHKSDTRSFYDNNGILHIGLYDFLLHPEQIN
ncbi:MAG: ATP-binding protein [Paludibacteraceae bacterium]|nr:ATP-binding protein [Paludibacteraceae bacterium]